MLEWVTLRRFQKHRRLTVEFAPGITTLSGPTDAGKSSVLRALRWVFDNRPLGKAFVSWGSDSCMVSVGIDGRTISRKVGKENLYVLDGVEFRAFGSAVPDEIRALAPASEVHWQGQHDAPFWLCKSAGEVAREMNRVINLDLIDASLARAARAERQARAVHEVVAARLKEAAEEAEQLQWVEGADRDLAAVEALTARADETQARARALTALLKDLRQAHDALGAVAAMAADRNELAARLREAAEELVTLHQVQSLLGKIRDLRDRTCQANQLATQARDAVRAETARGCPLCGNRVESPLPSSSATSTSGTTRRSAAPPRRTGTG